MAITALAVIQDAMERCNRLSPGETINGDDSTRYLRRLNVIVDELSAKAQFLFKSVLTSSAQTGHITLGAAPWAAIAPGDRIVSATADGVPMTPLTMAQYNALQSPADTGSPVHYAPDGLSTVYLYPVASGQTIKLHTLTGVAEFADLSTTSYTVPDGYRAALGARLAVRITPPSRITQQLLREEAQAIAGITRYNPAIVDVDSPSRSAGGRVSILTGA